MAVARSTPEYVQILQGYDEEKLTRRVIIPLLKSLGFEGIRYEHGRLERGKDLVFWKADEFGEKEWYAAQVKVGSASAAASDRNSLRTLINQLQQAYDSPFTDTAGNEISVIKCFFITPMILSADARESVKGLLRQCRVFRPVKIIDGPELAYLIRKNCPGVLMPWEENISSYCKLLERAFRPYLDYKALGLERQPILEDFYVDVRVCLRTETIFVRTGSTIMPHAKILPLDQEERLRGFRQEFKDLFNIEIRLSDVIPQPPMHTPDPTPGTKHPPSTEGNPATPNRRHGIRLDYTELAKHLADSISQLEAKRAGGFVIDNQTSALDLSSSTGIRKLIERIEPYADLLDSLVSLQPKDSFVPFRLEEMVDPFFLFGKFKRCWLAGQAGTGKSTLSRYYSIVTARNMDLEKEQTLIPVMLPLSSYDPSTKSLSEAILRSLAQYDVSTESLPQEKLLREGRFVVVLDGLDEIPGDEARRVFLGHLSEFEKAYPENNIVVTSRYIPAPKQLANFLKCHTVVFADEQILAFCDKWFARDENKRSTLRKLIEGNATFRLIARNPLCLTIIAALVENGRPIPERRAEVYRERLDLLLERWDYSRGVHRNRYEPELKLRVLKKLAFELHLKQRREFEYEDFLGVASKWAPAPFRDGDTLKDIFHELVVNNALVQQIDTGVYDFGHLSFQEYFVAREITDSGNLAFLKDQYLKDWWRQVTLLCGGIVRSGEEIIMNLFDSFQDAIPEDDRIIFHASEIVAEADWTPPELVQSIANALVGRYRRRPRADAIAALLMMRRSEAYRLFFDLLRQTPNCLSEPMVLQSISEVAGEAFYKELHSSFRSLPADVQERFVSLMKKRGTQVEEKYMALL